MTPDNPRLLDLVGGDPLRLRQLAAVLAHMWETAWAQGLFPELSPSRTPPPPATEAVAVEASRLAPEPSEPVSEDPVLPPIRTSWRDRRRRMDQLRAWVGGDSQRLQELIETTGRIWQAARRRPEVPP